DREGADRRDGLVVEYREPGSAGVDRFPDAAIHVAEIELVRPAGHAGHGVAAAAAERAEHAPVEADWNIEESGVRSLGTRREERLTLREPQRREGDAGLGELDEKVAARLHGYGATLAKYTSRFV